jgi:hypothetical protein
MGQFETHALQQKVLGHHFGPAGSALAKQTFTNFIEKASGLYEQRRRAISTAEWLPHGGPLTSSGFGQRTALAAAFFRFQRQAKSTPAAKTVPNSGKVEGIGTGDGSA